MRAWLNILRWNNLLIVFLTQLLIYGVVWVPVLKSQELTPVLDLWHFLLLALVTLLLAGGSYLINDLQDLETDRINRPNRVLISQQLSLKSVTQAYWIMSVLGLFISGYLAWHIRDWWQLLIYPVVWFLLWSYSMRFKKQLLVGNLVVAYFVAFVPGIIIYAERSQYVILHASNSITQEQISAVLGAYVLFAFLSTLFRELIKDLEDRDGDRQAGIRTAAVVWSPQFAQRFAIFIGGAWLLWQIGTLAYAFQQDWWISSLFLTLLSLGICWLLYLTEKATSKGDFHQISQQTKWLMIGGLLLLMIWKMEFL